MSPRVSVNSDPKAVPTLRSGRYSQSLERGLALLECFSAERPELGIADMAHLSGMSRSTTHRYVITLVKLGYLEQVEGRKYRLGVRGGDLGMAALDCIELRRLAHPDLVELRQRVSYTVSVAVLDRGQVMIMDWLRGFRGATRLDLDLGPGSRLPLYCTSAGKVLLAHLSEKESKAIVNGLVLARRGRGPNAITQRHVLSRELLQVRDAGLALSEEELKRGILSMAVPVHESADAAVAAMDVTVPVAMISRETLVGDLGPHLIAAAERVSAALASAAGEVQAETVQEASGGGSAL
jgi:IclR family pca regulon transcriptional regulator